jgi:hypothetical protein
MWEAWSCPRSTSSGNSTNGSVLNWRALRARPAGLAGLVALVVWVLSACGDPKQAATAEEPVLNIFNWADYIGYKTIAEFEHETHIKVIYGVYDSNETLEAKILAGQSRSTAASCRIGPISTQRCSRCRRRPIRAIATPFLICTQ